MNVCRYCTCIPTCLPTCTYAFTYIHERDICQSQKSNLRSYIHCFFPSITDFNCTTTSSCFSFRFFAFHHASLFLNLTIYLLTIIWPADFNIPICWFSSFHPNPGTQGLYNLIIPAGNIHHCYLTPYHLHILRHSMSDRFDATQEGWLLATHKYVYLY